MEDRRTSVQPGTGVGVSPTGEALGTIVRPDTGVPRGGSAAKATFTIVVPALNEERNIGPAVEAIVRTFGSDPDECEVLVFNDGSTDAAGERAEELARRYRNVREDYNMDPVKLPAAVTPRTKAVLPVHLTGRPCDMDPILEVAEERSLPVIEDCSQAVMGGVQGTPGRLLRRHWLLQPAPTQDLERLRRRGNAHHERS